MTRLLTVSQVRERLGIGLRQAWELVWRGDLPHVRIGRSVRVREEDVDAYVRSRVRVGRGPAA